MIAISQRKLKRYQRAERTCRALRSLLGKRQCEVTADDWALVSANLISWLRLAGREGYAQL